MDVFLIRVFQRQVLAQCQTLLAAAAAINQGLNSRNTAQVFNEIQNFLNAAANISKCLWGQRGAKAEQRKGLRESIGVEDDSPLRQVSMRNHFEHIDERIERWWEESHNHNIADFNIGPKNMIQGMQVIELFRSFDPATKVITFWGEDFNLQEIVTEIERLLPKLQEEANKPHWEEGCRR
jgi:hypothetical protein